VVDSGPSVAENCSRQLFRHFPHLAHVLAINELVKKIVLVRGKEGRGKGSKRDKRDQKKKFQFFFMARAIVP
jgi:hypothetical protein